MQASVCIGNFQEAQVGKDIGLAESSFGFFHNISWKNLNFLANPIDNFGESGKTTGQRK